MPDNSRFVSRPGELAPLPEDAEVAPADRISPLPFPLKEYSADQARDEHGRFSSEGGVGAVVQSAAQGAPGSGATIRPGTGTQPSEGVAVGGVAEPRVVPQGEFTRSTFADWLVANRSAFSDANMHIGVWVDESHNVWLEPSQVFTPDQRDAAVAAGAARNQIAVYDLGAGREIPTGGTGELPPKG